jgi:hypothetical protein
MMQRLRSWWTRWRGGATAKPPLNERQQAQALIAAIDRGGLPLNPARVNQIARNLGLEVSAHAPMAATVERIRQALARGG